MDKIIYKYPIRIGLTIIKDSYQNAKILSMGTDLQGQLCIWALVDKQAPKAELKILCAGTGWPLPQQSEMKFIGTTHWDSGIWHAFQLTDAEGDEYESV